jgi:predicted glycosyltransferase
LEKELLARYRGGEQRVLLVQGLLNRPATRIKRGNITIVPSMTDSELVPALLGAQHIIARSGYSTIMDLETLGLMQKAELIPTPGQPEQEYLAFWTEKRTSK